MPSKDVFNTFEDAVRSAKGEYFEGNVAQMILLFCVSQE
jgi:hypothetical protein